MARSPRDGSDCAQLCSTASPAPDEGAAKWSTMSALVSTGRGVSVDAQHGLATYSTPDERVECVGVLSPGGVVLDLRVQSPGCHQLREHPQVTARCRVMVHFVQQIERLHPRTFRAVEAAGSKRDHLIS